MGKQSANTTVETEAEEIGVGEAIDQEITDLQNAARETFSLRDKLQGVTKSVKPKRVPLYMDLDAVTEVNAAKKAYDEVKSQLDYFEEADSIDAAVIENARKRLAVAGEALVAPTERMLANAISALLRPIPRVAIKDARRRGKKDIGVEKGKVPAEQQEEYDDAVNRRVLGKMLVEVRDAEGNVYDNDARALQELLPESQWIKLMTTVNTLTFEDAVSDAATDDPGF